MPARIVTCPPQAAAVITTPLVAVFSIFVGTATSTPGIPCPHWNRSPNPHEYATPSAFAMAILWLEPEDIAVNAVSVTLCGAIRQRGFPDTSRITSSWGRFSRPIPTWWASIRPQAKREPSLVRAIEWRSPPSIWRISKLSSARTQVGTGTISVVLSSLVSW